jgi:hypothetical protein
MDTALWIKLLISSVMLVLCVAVHGFGLFSLSKALRTEASVERMRNLQPLSRRGVLFTLAIVIALVALHGLEIWLYAVVYLVVGAVENLEQALYFSTISYSTVGYSDAHIAADWRLLGAFESILGVILLGWSTAFFIRMLSRIDAH